MSNKREKKKEEEKAIVRSAPDGSDNYLCGHGMDFDYTRFML